MSVRDKIVRIIKRSDKLAESLLSPNINLVETLEIISARGMIQGALGKAITIFLTLFFAGLSWDMCAIIAVIIFFWDIAPVLLKQNRKAAAIAKILTLLAVQKQVGPPSTIDIVMRDVKEALKDGVITKDEFIQIIRDIVSRHQHITVEKVS